MAITNPFNFQPGGLLDYLNDVPQAGYTWFLGQHGVSPFSRSPFASYTRGVYGDLYNDYQSRLPSNPSMLWTDYLKGFNPQAQFRSLSPRERGERVGGGAGTVRWQVPV